jgi:hypothetical protein
MGTSLLHVLRTVALDADARSAFEADPSGYLSQYGYQDVPLDDLEEAVGLMADTLPPEAAMEIAPGTGDPGLVGALRGEQAADDGGDLAPDGEASGDLATAFGEADFDGEPDTTSDEPAEPGDSRAEAAEADSGSPATTGADELGERVDFGSGSVGTEQTAPELEQVPDGPDFDEPGFDQPDFGADLQPVDGVDMGDTPAGEVAPTESADDPSFDEAEAFSSQMEAEALDTPEPDIDDIGSF